MLLHPGDDMLWKASHPEAPYWRLDDGQRIAVAGTEIRVVHTPGHSPGVGVSAPARGRRAVLRRHPVLGRARRHRTLLQDFPTIIDSIRERMLALPEDTRVHTGHGDHTTIGTEAPHLADWIARGH